MIEWLYAILAKRGFRFTTKISQNLEGLRKFIFLLRIFHFSMKIFAKVLWKSFNFADIRWNSNKSIQNILNLFDGSWKKENLIKLFKREREEEREGKCDKERIEWVEFSDYLFNFP